MKQLRHTRLVVVYALNFNQFYLLFAVSIIPK